MDCIHCNKTEKPWLNKNYPCKVYYCSYQPGGEAARHWNYDPKGLNEVRSTYCNARYCDNFTPAGEDILSHTKAQRHEEEKKERRRMDEWIDVKGRLPDYDQPVFVMTIDNKYSVWKRVKIPDATKHGDYPFFWEDQNVLDYIDKINEKNKKKQEYVLFHPESVTHWMPLPGPPKITNEF